MVGTIKVKPSKQTPLSPKAGKYFLNTQKNSFLARTLCPLSFVGDEAVDKEYNIHEIRCVTDEFNPLSRTEDTQC